CLSRMRTISRSKSTVVVKVSWEREMEHKKHKRHKKDKNLVPLVLLVFLFLFCACDHIERKRNRMDLVVAAELGPCAVVTRFGHQAFEGHIRTAAKFFEVGARRNRELRRAAVVIGLREDVEWMRVNVIHHVLAHDKRVPESTKISLQIGYRPTRSRIF